MQSRLSGPSGGGGGGRSSARQNYGSSYGGGDAGFRDNQSRSQPRNMSSRNSRSMPPMDMVDNASMPGANFGAFGEYGGGAGHMPGGGAHGFQGYGAAPSFRHGGPEFNLDPTDDTRTMKVSIKNEDAGAIIGPKGSTINRVRERSGCSIKIDDGKSADSIRGMRIITITGTDQQIQFAQYLMQQR